MRSSGAILPVMVLAILVCGCSTVPENLSPGPQSWHDVGLDGSVKAPVGGQVATGELTVPVAQQGFVVLDFQAKRDAHGMVFIVGEVKNVGTATKGVELQIALRDNENQIVAVESFCPAGNHSIVPGETRPFAYSFGRQDAGVNAEVRVVRTFYTMDTLGLAALIP